MPRAVAGLLTIVCGVLLAPAVASAQTETIEFFALDTVGSVRVVFDQNGNVVKRADYEPFGAPVAQPPLPNEDIYAGLWRDEAGLDYAQARMYQRSTGRFNAPDPIFASLEDPQQWNRYAYARNSPLKFVDADGRQIKSRSEPGCTTHPTYCQESPGRSGDEGDLAEIPDANDGGVPGPQPPGPIPPGPLPPGPTPPGPVPPGPTQPGPTPPTTETPNPQSGPGNSEEALCRSNGRVFSNTFANRFQDTFWVTNDNVPGILAPPLSAVAYGALRTGSLSGFAHAAKVPTLRELGRTVVSAARNPSMARFAVAAEAATLVKSASLFANVGVGIMFEAGVALGSAIDASVLHPCAGGAK